MKSLFCRILKKKLQNLIKKNFLRFFFSWLFPGTAPYKKNAALFFFIVLELHHTHVTGTSHLILYTYYIKYINKISYIATSSTLFSYRGKEKEQLTHPSQEKQKEPEKKEDSAKGNISII